MVGDGILGFFRVIEGDLQLEGGNHNGSDTHLFSLSGSVFVLSQGEN